MNQANDVGSFVSPVLLFVVAIASGLIREREEIWGDQKLPRGHVSKQPLTILYVVQSDTHIDSSGKSWQHGRPQKCQ